MSLVACTGTTNQDNNELAVPQHKPLSVQAAEQPKKWWVARHDEKLVEKQKMQSVDMVFIGDSITHAFDYKSKAIWEQYYAPRNALNIGFNGDRTEHVLWRLQHGAIDNIQPKLVVLMIGTNNTGHRQDSPEDTASGIKAILKEITRKLPDTQVLLLAIFPRGETPDSPLRKINDTVNNIIQEYDDGDRVHYLNINHVFLDANGNLSRDVMKDLLHPNKDQYEHWAKAIEPMIENLL
ncbi:GDSL-type esterase/lipase family protein [Aliiglaciecola lipolytica]|nr:GDSL-type esterase/lipase family protein [Aliiglaciecola lipolytica]